MSYEYPLSPIRISLETTYTRHLIPDQITSNAGIQTYWQAFETSVSTAVLTYRAVVYPMTALRRFCSNCGNEYLVPLVTPTANTCEPCTLVEYDYSLIDGDEFDEDWWDDPDMMGDEYINLNEDTDD